MCVCNERYPACNAQAPYYIVICGLSGSRLRLKCDGTRAETRFCLSAKRTSPYKTAGASVQSTTGSRGVRISGSNAGYTKFRGSEGNWLPIPFAGFPFTSPPVSHRVPSHFNWALPHLSALPHKRHDLRKWLLDIKCLFLLSLQLFSEDGFGGLVVSILASGTQVRGFKPGRSSWIFRTEKSSACLPPEGN